MNEHPGLVNGFSRKCARAVPSWRAPTSTEKPAGHRGAARWRVARARGQERLGFFSARGACRRIVPGRRRRNGDGEGEVGVAAVTAGAISHGTGGRLAAVGDDACGVEQRASGPRADRALQRRMDNGCARGKLAATAAASEAADRGAGWSEAITPATALRHATAAARAVGPLREAAIAKQLAKAARALHGMNVDDAAADVYKLAAGMALQWAMKQRGHGVDKLPATAATVRAAVAELLTYLFPVGGGERAASPGAGQPGASGEAARASPPLNFSTEAMEALRGIAGIAAASSADASKPDNIILGRATADAGTMRRPEFFSVGDIAAFDTHEAALETLSGLEKASDAVFKKALEELPEAARELLNMPVHPNDLMKNQRLHVLKALAERSIALADNIILQGTVLSSERETDEQRAEDKERAAALRYLGQGDLVKGGPQCCVVTHRLDSLWTFLQIPYRHNQTAAVLNGSWDTAWLTWAKVAEARLGKECEVVEATKKIVSMVRVQSLKGHFDWPDQTRADYPAVALFFFTRDYCAWREGRPDSAKPSLLRILTSKDFMLYLNNCIDYGYKEYMRLKRPPYTFMRLGAATSAKRRKAISMREMGAMDDSDGDADVDGDVDDAAKTRKTKTQKRKERKKRKKAEEATTRKRSGGDGGGRGGGDADSDDDDGARGGRTKKKAARQQVDQEVRGGKRPEAIEWKRIENAGSAWPNMTNRFAEGRIKVLQSLMDKSNGLDEGCCAA